MRGATVDLVVVKYATCVVRPIELKGGAHSWRGLSAGGDVLPIFMEDEAV